jgi:hypothetical protein
MDGYKTTGNSPKSTPTVGLNLSGAAQRLARVTQDDVESN